MRTAMPKPCTDPFTATGSVPATGIEPATKNREEMSQKSTAESDEQHLPLVIEGQSPATRSSLPQHPENTQKTASQQAESCACATQVGHICTRISASTLSNRSENRSQQWVTRLGHKRSTRGLSLRGSVYQFRVRVPADLRKALERTHVKRSLRTDSLALAIRLRFGILQAGYNDEH
jgi:hypothetical protein